MLSVGAIAGILTVRGVPAFGCRLVSVRDKILLKGAVKVDATQRD